MARRLEGSTYESRGVHYASITVAQRKRESFALPTCKTAEQAKARTKIVNDVVQRLRGAGHADIVPRFAKEAAERPAGKELDRLMSAVNGLCCGSMVPRDALLDGSLFREVGGMWTSEKLAQEYRGQVSDRKGLKDIEALLEKHVYPYVGDIPVPLFGMQHAQIVLNKYPKENDPGSLRNIAKLVNRVINLAVKPLGLIPSNPLPSGWIPKAGPKKSRSCVYPPEDVQLMACTEVDIGLRVLWGYLHREGHRKGEVFRLTFSDFDLKLGTINLRKNKTDDPRFWVLSPGVAAMLRTWKRYREEVLGERVTGDSFVFFGCSNEHPGTKTFHAAKVYRQNLLTAGIDRSALHMHGGNHKQVRAHDTRAAFVTVALVHGRNEMWISDRTGHSSLDEMKTYRRNARAFVELNLGDWRPLDQLIPELQPYLADASQKEQMAQPSEQTTSAPDAPVAASPVAASSAVPSRRKARHAPEAPPVPVAEGPAAVVEASPTPLVAAVAPACEEVQEPDAGELAAAAPVCTSDEGRLEPHNDAPEAIVGANVGAPSGLWLGAGFVGVANQRDLPWMMGAQSPPTFGRLISSSGTVP